MSRPRPKKSDRPRSSSAPIDPTPITPAFGDAPTLPVGALMLRDATDEQFAAMKAALLALIGPADPLGRLLAELVVLAADRLRNAARLEPEGTLPDIAWCRYQGLAERNFRAAAKDLHRHLDRLAVPVPSASKTAAVAAIAEPEPEPEPEPTLPESTPEEIAEASIHWRDHIALVRSVSEEWPILLRLRREVEDVAAWLLDGKSEEELMRWYPGLTRADIAACRACDAADLCGPFDPADGPYPPGLPVFDDLPDADADAS